MTLTTIILWIAFALLFAITNSISYNRGNDSGYNKGNYSGYLEGLEDGLHAAVEKQINGTYKIEFKRKEQ